jgi:hypothetical protein
MILDLKELRAAVALMRELGVSKWNGIELGEVPSPKAAPSKRKTMQERQDEEDAAKDRKLKMLLGGTPSAELAAKLRRVI